MSNRQYFFLICAAAIAIGLATLAGGRVAIILLEGAP
jgi:hypothetical protein